MTREVAIIGAGPGGIAAARWLLSRDFDVRIYESHTELGGQWSCNNPASGVWPQMVTNTFLEATRFSDFPFPKGTPIYPHNSAVRDYFENYARAFGVFDRIVFQTRVTHLRRHGKRWELTLQNPATEWVETCPQVVVATGRFNSPMIPSIEGSETFTGDMGLIHSFDYKDPFAYQGKTVVVLGGSISSLEIASDLSMLGTKKVYLAQRRQRYVNPKMFLGTPIEYRLFTYERGRLALDDPEGFLSDSEAKILEHAGDPSRYGTPKPHPEFAKAGATGSQHYLNLVAEGRIKPVSWPQKIDGQKVLLPDGECFTADGLIAGTGFGINLPFCSEEIRTVLNLSRSYIELDEFTLHPDLPGLAFIGFWSQAGSYPTPLEQQARYLTYIWAGELKREDAQMRQGLRACRENGHHVGYRTQSEMALRFARLCGCDPIRFCVNDAQQKLISDSPTVGPLYRLCGPDALPGAIDEIEALQSWANS